MRYMKKAAAITLLPLLFIFLLSTVASAELSTNLQLRTETHPKTKKILSQTYTDPSGNAVIADDKGYATERYTYNNQGQIILTEYLNPAGELVNCIDGYAQIADVYRSGKKTRTEYRDAEGNLVIGPEGFAVRDSLYYYGKHQEPWE